MPLRGLGTEEAELCFSEFAARFTDDYTGLYVYCDGFGSLVKLCDTLGLSRKHPPPQRHEANSVVERQIGTALAGIRSYLATACLPNCFWPFAGRCFAFNDNSIPKKNVVVAGREKRRA